MENEITKISDPKLSGGLKLSELQRIGNIFAKSGYFSDVKDIAQACVKILAGAELGFSPIASMSGVYIVKGRPSLSAQLMATAVSRYGFRSKVVEHTDQVCKIEFFRGTESLGVSTFSMKDANQAGLSGGDNWKKYPRNMLWARAMSNGARWFCAEAFGGGQYYTPEELEGDEGLSVTLPSSSPTPAIEEVKEALSLEALQAVEEEELVMGSL